jgi:acetoacetyl-CoA synthetase
MVTSSAREESVAHSQLTAFMQWCEVRTGQPLPDHAAMDRFSVEEFRSFWRLLLEWSGLPRDGAVDPVCVGDACATARFFPDLRLNYAECLLAGSPDQSVLTACHAGGSRDRFTRGALRVAVARLATSLQRLGVRRGDHVVAIARNNAGAVIAALATAAIGATFASCAPDMGVPAILARFAPLDPVVLFGSLRAEPWDPGVPVAERVTAAAAGLPSLVAIIALDNSSLPTGERTVPLHRLADLLRDAVDGEDRPGWLRHPFNQPLFTMFSSGTTGAPKCIQHGAGGTLLEHVKEHRLHCDLAPGDRLFFQTSCGWMMWNWQLSALASCAEIVLYDGPVGEPDTLWRIVSQERVTVFGTNPGFLQYCADAGFRPAEHFPLPDLRAVLSTGSILFDKQYDWVRQHVKLLPLQSISGGTDIIGCFVLGNPNLCVYRGESQCKSLGLDVQAWQQDGPGRLGETGELICANPFPSRPLGLYGDPDGERFHRAYFSQNAGMWTHGDFIEFTPRGTARMQGRSDGVLNVRGIRIGPAEIYRILQELPEIQEAMAIEQVLSPGPEGSRLVLLVVLRRGLTLERALILRIKRELSRRGSPAHVPAVIAQVEELPMTHSGKRSERAAYNALNGRQVSNFEALRNPGCLDALKQHPALQVGTATV